MVASGSVSKHSSNSSTTSTRRSCSRSALEGCAAPPLPRTCGAGGKCGPRWGVCVDTTWEHADVCMDHVQKVSVARHVPAAASVDV
eukprot:312802-Chlamydomonas_euryale.AAC.2